MVIYEKPIPDEWEKFVLKQFPNFECIPASKTSVESFKKALIEISDRETACNILARLLHQDLAYDAEIMPLEEAKLFADKLFSLFSNQTAYFSNSTWNEHEYSQVNNDFKLGLSSWTSFTEATFDSGIIICDIDKIGIAWFADED
ncbi:hypothetical protein A8B98_25440 [Hymenobacter sp. UV11]|nr:hypothetical protein A8B98_25440 [Hymenobacter sp. UV11]